MQSSPMTDTPDAANTGNAGPDALIDAYWFDGAGNATPLTWEELDQPRDGPGFPWIHLQRDVEETRTFLLNRSGLPRLVCDAMTATESRPRTTAFDEGIMVDLRGVNLNPGADKEDMVSLRMWCDGQGVISVRRRRLMAVDDVRAAIKRKQAPKTPAALMIMLADGLTNRMGAVITDLDEMVDDLEDQVVEAQSQDLRFQLGAIRRQAIGLRRFIGPDREAIQRLVNDPADWMDQSARLRMREVADKITRYVEDLDSARERAAVVQDELSSRLAERLNKNTYVLSVIAAIFLPLGLLTGLLGINVGGMPGEKAGSAFWIVTVGLVVIGAIEYWLLKKLKWI
ncbi:MAG: zinc transporter ZntB [Alphaproteobacteria bacterium]